MGSQNADQRVKHMNTGAGTDQMRPRNVQVHSGDAMFSFLVIIMYCTC